MSVLFFKPIPRMAIWGNTAVKNYFNYNDFPNGVGQTWAFSTQESASNICKTEPFIGYHLDEMWKNYPELFGNPTNQFPVIISLVGPEDNLSVQIHPDKEKASEMNLPSGKNEAWYFIESDDDASIIYGINANNKLSLKELIEKNNWSDLLKKCKVKSDDFVYLPAGIVHAMGKNNIVYEIQESLDVTFRLYDYDRTDSYGNRREMNVEKGLECVNFELSQTIPTNNRVITFGENVRFTYLFGNESFQVKKWDILGKTSFFEEEYQLATVINGCGSVNKNKIIKGDSFLITVNTLIELDGRMSIMLTTGGKKYE